MLYKIKSYQSTGQARVIKDSPSQQYDLLQSNIIIQSLATQFAGRTCNLRISNNANFNAYFTISQKEYLVCEQCERGPRFRPFLAPEPKFADVFNNAHRKSASRYRLSGAKHNLQTLVLNNRKLCTRTHWLRSTTWALEPGIFKGSRCDGYYNQLADKRLGDGLWTVEGARVFVLVASSLQC